MNKSLITIISAFLFFACPTFAHAQVDWKSFLSKQDLVWDRLPQAWHEAPFMGNGSLGTYLCQEPGANAIRLDVGNNLVHDHRADDPAINGRCRLLIGYFLLHPVGEIVNGKMRLDLWNAEAKAHILTSEGEIRMRVYVASGNPYIVAEVETAGGENGFRWQFYPECTDSPRQIRARKTHNAHLEKDYVSNPPSEVSEHDGVSLCWQPLLDGGGTATAWKIIKEGKTTTLVINNTHTYPETDAPAMAEVAVKQLQADDMNAIQSIHRDWWHRFYPQSFISLPDKRLENFYWIQMYKMASATRIGGGLMDNCGPWLVDTPWPNTWWNLNVQLAYWPVYPSNRLELGVPLVDAVAKHLDNLINNVPEAYRHNSAALPVSTAFDLAGPCVNPPYSGKHAQIGCLPWLCHNLWLHYRFSMDERVLRHVVYPTLRRAVNFYIHFLKEDEKGVLHLNETFSPEYGNAEDCNFDLALLRWGCQTLLRSAQIFSIDDELIPQWNNILQKLTDYPQDETGMMIGKDTPYARSHRHYSHLLMFYPLYLLNTEQPGSKELMERSVEHWHSIPGNIFAYSYTGASSIYAAFGEGDKALEKLNHIFTMHSLMPNTLYKESGPVIETPLSAAQCIHDMLLQSWGGKLRVFPAVPSSWKEISFKDLRTEGAFLVSATRQGGKTTSIRIESLADEPCLLRTDMENPVVKLGNATLTTVSPCEYRLNLRKGESVVLTPDGASIPCLREVNGEGQNYFGVKSNP